MSSKEEFASRIIKGNREDREKKRAAKRAKYAQIQAKQQAERERIAEMLAAMTEEERKAFWAEKRKSATSGPEHIYH